MVEARQFPEALEFSVASHELLAEAINTVPLPPRYVEASFFAGGVLSPRSHGDKKDEDRTRYLDECKKQGVMPFTNMDFEYDGISQLFVPSRYQDKANTSKYFSGEQIKSSEVDLLFKGGKIHRMEFKSRPSEFTESMFSEFKRNLVNLSGEGYQMGEAELSLTVFRRGGYDEGTFGDTEVYLRKLSRPIERQYIMVRFGGISTSDEMKQEVLNWFDTLKEKYS